MALAFYLDHHVRREVAGALQRRGVDVLTCLQDGTAEWSDAALLDRAAQLGRVMVSQDRDMLVEAGRRRSSGVSLPGLVYAHQLWMPSGRLIEDLDLMAKVLDPAEIAGCVVFLPLK